ncbi:uncharacterized protein RJT21DRAFT_115473 [Scheffersomyces amazonensis]|uniref:uncharacterized protein n=1 Tax=Scheffersomyces amazonensis TaxID=1078765 RepID=UPI00315C91F4
MSSNDPISKAELEPIACLLSDYKCHIKRIESEIKTLLRLLNIDPVVASHNTPTISNIVTNLSTMHIIKIKLCSQIDILGEKYKYFKVAKEVSKAVHAIVDRSTIIRQYDELLDKSLPKDGKLLNLLDPITENPYLMITNIKNLYLEFHKNCRLNIYKKISIGSEAFYKNLPSFSNSRGKYLPQSLLIYNLSTINLMDEARLDRYLEFYEIGGLDLPLEFKQEYLCSYLKLRMISGVGKSTNPKKNNSNRSN